MFLFVAGLALGKRIKAEKSFQPLNEPATVADKPRRRKGQRRRKLSFNETVEAIPTITAPRRRSSPDGWNNCNRNEQWNELGPARCMSNIECRGNRHCHKDGVYPAEYGGKCAGHHGCLACNKYKHMSCKKSCPKDRWGVRMRNAYTTNHGCCSSWTSCGGNMKNCNYDQPSHCGGLSPGYKWFTVTVKVVDWGNEMSFDIGGCRYMESLTPGGGWTDGSTHRKRCSVVSRVPSTYKLFCLDSYGDGWHGGYVEINGKRYCENFKTGKMYTETVRL